MPKDELIEYARYVKNYYGLQKEYVRKQLDAGKDVILEIEIQGALKSERGISRYFAFVVTPPSAGELKKARRQRHRDDGCDRVQNEPCM